jgi:flagellar assembly factor FliW
MPMGNPYDNSSTNPYETVDLDQWLESLELEDNKITLFALVSVKDEENKGLNVTANMRAPIIVDNESMNAWQIILDNPAYEIAYKLNVDS